MDKNLVSLEKAQEVYAETIKGVPDLPLPKLGYSQDSPTGPNGEKNYCVVWENEGYNPEVVYLDEQQSAPGSITEVGGPVYYTWPQTVTNEYNAAKAAHQKASQYGLPEGIQWVFVETGV